MRDVAALAHVSLKTVSRVVNEEAGVSPPLAARVEEAIRLLGYRPNLTASNLRRAGQRTATIGLLLDDVANPFSSMLHRAVEDVAAARRTLVFAGSSDEDPDREAEVVDGFAARRVDGVIAVVTGQGRATLAMQHRFGKPVVLVDRRVDLPGADSVTVDNREGVRDAVGRLVALGHARIAYLGDRHEIWTAGERYLGYQDGLAAAGLPLDSALVRLSVHGAAPAVEATVDLLRLRTPPTAIVAGQNLITLGAVRALQERGQKRRVALIGFDDFPLADLLDPPVSVIAQNPAALGRVAAERLFARIDGDAGPEQHVVVPTRFVARGSGEIPAPGGQPA